MCGPTTNDAWMIKACGWFMQAYGAGAWHSVGSWAQRGWLICMLTCVPVMAVWLAAEPLLLLVGQTPEVSRMTSAYLRCDAHLSKV